jgi:hypothetical protein
MMRTGLVGHAGVAAKALASGSVAAAKPRAAVIRLLLDACIVLS